MPAHYVGKPRVEFLSNGREVRLVEDFAFSDEQELLWTVPAPAVVDGASIPSVFWSVIGGPFEGKYRDASIIHDWFCDTRLRTWQATHLVFYEAMIVSTVPIHTAKVMYFAVYWGGPRWERRVSRNMEILIERMEYQWRQSMHSGNTPETARRILKKIARKESYPPLANEEIDRLVHSVSKGGPYYPDLIVPSANPATKTRRPARLEDFAHIVAEIEKRDPSLEEIAYLADSFLLS